ncbi:putative transcription factor WD40-like family [Lupinus albus]|uniref:Putative transcription factor WD40-like family n=1 Tax=Lupinus albus TaxID=3870 RepID=A0A6A4R4T1_LUPAL|nr:putative transcription factor WD40-like family [Lupinus albus]
MRAKALSQKSCLWFFSMVYMLCIFCKLLIPPPTSRKELIINSLVHLLFRFAERGKIFTKQEVRAIQLGPGGIFFTGDGTGQVKVWNWIAEPTTSIQ